MPYTWIKNSIPYACLILITFTLMSCDYILGKATGACTYYYSFDSSYNGCIDDVEEDYCMSELENPSWYEDKSCSEVESTGGDTGNGGGCGTYSDSFSPADVQVIAQCQAAYAYTCAGNQEGVNATCAIIRAYGSSNISKCPYCSN